MTLYAEAQDQLRHVRMTLEAVEHSVAIVYGHFSNGRLTKCNTDPQQVIAVIEDVINESTEELQQERDKYASGWRDLTVIVEQMQTALQNIWKAGDLNDKQMDAYRRVIPFKGPETLPLYESSKDPLPRVNPPGWC